MTLMLPSRADHVGSFLRPQRLRDAREAYASGTLDQEGLRAIEDDCIAAVVRHQEAAGLRAITDGEFRRHLFHVDFLEKLEGIEVRQGTFTSTFRKQDGTEVGYAPPTLHVVGPVRHRGSIQGADFEALSAVVTQTPKVCIPSPTMLHFRGGRDAIDAATYPDLEGFYDDLAAAFRAEIADLARRGCRYIQLDDTNLAYLCDPALRQKTADRGDDPDALTRRYCALINASLAEKPADMIAAIHLCRGNFKSAWVAEGGYEPVAEILFNELAVDAFFLEYDDERSGDFAPLRHVPSGKLVVLGLMTSKRGALESEAELITRIEEAAQFLPLDQLALSPQCGFSSSEYGNDLTEAQQWAKVERLVAVANTVWR